MDEKELYLDAMFLALLNDLGKTEVLPVIEFFASCMITLSECSPW